MIHMFVLQVQGWVVTDTSLLQACGQPGNIRRLTSSRTRRHGGRTPIVPGSGPSSCANQRSESRTFAQNALALSTGKQLTTR